MAHVHHSPYFSRFPSFTPSLRLPIEKEFLRLAKAQGWKLGGHDYAEQRSDCLLAEFDFRMGGLEENLEKWQSLCGDLRLEPIPGSINKCKQVCIYR